MTFQVLSTRPSHQVFTEQKYMYSFDPYDNVYTCRLPAGMPSAAAPVDEAGGY